MTTYVTVEIREEIVEFPYYRTRSYMRRVFQANSRIVAEGFDRYLNKLEAYWANAPKPPYHWLGAEAEAS